MNRVLTPYKIVALVFFTGLCVGSFGGCAPQTQSTVDEREDNNLNGVGTVGTFKPIGQMLVPCFGPYAFPLKR